MYFDLAVQPTDNFLDIDSTSANLKINDKYPHRYPLSLKVTAVMGIRVKGPFKACPHEAFPEALVAHKNGPSSELGD